METTQAEGQDRLVMIRTCGGNLEASMLRSILEANGIPCVIQGENHRSLLGVMGPYVELRLLVPAEHAEEAERILRESEQAGSDEPPATLGATYREPYPLRPDGERAPRPLQWRPLHTWLSAAALLLVLALAIAVVLGNR